MQPSQPRNLTRRQMITHSAAFIAASGALTESELFETPDGFWLAPSNHSNNLYGATSSQAKWNISQWDIPEDLPPFSHNASTNKYASVRILGKGVYELEQNGFLMPCDRRFSSGRTLTNEFDLFVAPNGRTTPKFPQAAAKTFLPLSEISVLNHNISVDLLDIKSLSDTCRLNQVALLTALVLVNPSAKQTLFYQLRLHVSRLLQGRMSKIFAPPNWFFSGQNIQSGQGGQFGFSDNLATYGFHDSERGESATYKLKMIDRINNVIQLGEPHGMSQSFENWFLRGTYHGSSVFGHTSIHSRWSGFSLRVS